MYYNTDIEKNKGEREKMIKEVKISQQEGNITINICLISK